MEKQDISFSFIPYYAKQSYDINILHNTVSLATKWITPILNENELSSSKDIHDLKISENTSQTSNCYSADQNLKSNKASNLESENVNLNVDSLTKLFHKALLKAENL